MKQNFLAKLFIGFFILTFVSFSIAGYATKRARTEEPDVLAKIGNYYKINITDSNGGFYISGMGRSFKNYEKADRTWDINGQMHLENLTVSTRAADVVLEKSPDSNFHIIAKGMIDKSESSDLFEVGSNDNELSITDHDKHSKDVTLKVQIPNGFMKNMKISTISGDLKISGIQSDELKVVSISGDIKLTEISAKEIEAKSTSGDINIDNRIASNIETKSISGDVKVKSQDLDKSEIKVKSISGTIVNPYRGVSDGKTRLTANTISGDIEISGKAE